VPGLEVVIIGWLVLPIGYFGLGPLLVSTISTLYFRPWTGFLNYFHLLFKVNYY